MEELVRKLIAAVASSTEDIDITLTNIAKEMGLTEDEIKVIKESFNQLNLINEKAINLEKAKSESCSRNGWITEELNQISNKSIDNSNKIIEDIHLGIDTDLLTLKTNE